MRVSMESGKKKNFKKNMKPLLHQLLHNSSIFRLLCCCTKTTNNAYYRNITLFCPFLATISEHNYYMSEIILFFNRSLTPLSFNSKNNFSFQKIRKIFIRFTTSNLLTIHIMSCNCLHTKKPHKFLSNLHCIFSRPLKRCFYLNCVWAFEDHQKPLGLFVIVAEIKQFTKTEEKIHF